MGKTILCTGVITENPFLFPQTNTRLYSMEELCYYVYNNIYSLSVEDFKVELADWLETELKLPVTAEKIRRLLRRGDTLKDIVITILCSADYYSEEEIKALLLVMNKLESCTSLERDKLCADHLLQQRDLKHAEPLYYRILEEAEECGCGDAFIGNVLHNMGILKLWSSSYLEAAKWFEQAYVKNKNQASQKAGFLCAAFAQKAAFIPAEEEKEQAGSNALQTIQAELEEVMREAEAAAEYRQLEKLKSFKGAGKMDKYYAAIEQMITKWKDEYKNGLI